MREYLVFAEQAALLDVQYNNDALATDLFGGTGDEFRIGQRRRAQSDLLDAKADDRLYLLDRFHAAAIAQGHAAFRCQRLDQCIVGLAPVYGGIDIDDDQFVNFFLIENAHGVKRVADILWAAEVDGLDQPAILDQ
ncbi:hypothetical protein D3C81_1767430 [compost metagenome]